jgi:hypothetical protein
LQVFYRDEAEMAEAGMPWRESMRGDWPGINAFLQTDGEVYHTDSTYGRCIDLLVAPPGLLGHYPDLTALGRQEESEEPKDARPPASRPVAPTCVSPTNTTRPRSRRRSQDGHDVRRGIVLPGRPCSTDCRQLSRNHCTSGTRQG